MIEHSKVLCLFECDVIVWFILVLETAEDILFKLGKLGRKSHTAFPMRETRLHDETECHGDILLCP